MNSFIRDASSILERTIKFNTKLDPYTTNEIWHRWIKMETQIDDIDDYLNMGLDLLQLQLDNERNIRKSFKRFNQFFIKHHTTIQTQTNEKYLKFASQTYLNSYEILNTIYEHIKVNENATLNMLKYCADLQCNDMNLVSKLIDQLHPQELDINTYLYCLLVLFPQDQTSLLVNLIKSKDISKINKQNYLLLKQLYDHKNIELPNNIDINSFQENYNPRKNIQSLLQRDIEILLNVVKLSYEQEKIIENLYQVDFYLPENKLILEVNGPQHYVYNIEADNPQILNGKHYYKQMVLAAAGYELKNLCFLDFYRSKGITQKLALLKATID